jgi:TP901 family phage tail tape measure protein
LADIEVTFEADDGPIRGVIGRLSKEIINFAKRSEAAFGGIQSGLQGIGRAGSLSERALEGQRRQLEAIQKASRFEARSTFGFDQRQIAEIQRALSSSTSEARELSQEFSQQNSFLRDQVAQYERVLLAQRRVNDLVGQQGGVRAIEAQASPQLTSQPTSSIGLTDSQIAAIQVELAKSVASARELTQEFIKQNAAVSDSKDVVLRQSSEMERFGKSSADSFGQANKGAVLLASEFGVIQGEIIDSSKAVEKFGDDIIDVEDVTQELGEEISRSGKKAKSSWVGLLNNIGTGDLPGLRYALYDIGNNLQRIGLTLTAVSAAPLLIAANYEREFANVIRTNDLARDDVKDLRNSLRRDLEAIAQSTPINWKDITNIATLAGQLGIAQESVAQFTETVAKFSATTDLSVENAATAFGRLDQLISGIDGNFENLGSAILAVGVDSVATESAIVNVSTQIASMGNLAGLSAAEIVGLSGALASLGIKPELARGTVTRLFSNIGAAASTSGEEVSEFGRLTGRTADQFVSDWSSEPGAVLQDFFEGINKEGPEAERTLRSLGITSVRDIPAILRLAQSSDEVRRLIRLSTSEYIKASEVTEQYGIISSTVSAQITRLGQNFELLQSSLGASVNLFSGLIGILNLVVQGYNYIVDNPIGAAISGLIIGVGLLVGGLALLVAQAVFLSAGILAVAFVMRKLGINMSRAQVFQLLFKKGIDETIASLYSQAIAAGVSGKALDSLTVGLSRAKVGAKVFQGALRSLLISTGIGIAIVAVTAAIGFFVEKASQAGKESEELYGSLEGLSEALIKDGKEFDELTGKMKDGSDAMKFYRKDLDAVDDNLVDLEGSFRSASEEGANFEEVIEKGNAALEKQENLLLAASNNVLEFFREAALRDEDLVRLFGDPRVLQAASDTGTGIRQLFENAISGIDVGPDLDAIRGQLESQIGAFQQRLNELNYEGGQGTAEGLAIKEDIAEIEASLARLEGAEIFFDGISETIDDTAKLADGANALNGELEVTAELSTFLDDNLTELNKTLFEEARFIKGVEDSLGGLAKALAENADNAQMASGAIGDLVGQIINDPTQNVDQILGNLGGLLTLLQTLEAQGVDTALSQEFVRASIEATGAQANMETEDIVGYAQGLNALVNFDAANFQQLMADALDGVGSSAGGAAEKVKTLSEQFDELVDSMFEAINLGTATEEAIFALGEAFGETGDEALYASEEMQDAIGSILAQSGSAEEGVANLAALFSNLAKTVGGESAPALQILRQAISQVAAQFGISEAQAQQFIDTVGGGISTINFDNFNRGIQNAQQEVRTLLDYASDLESIFGRAFDIRFASTFAIDTIAEAWFDLGQNVEDARREVDDLIASQQDLGADRALKEYFLSVADAYGDTLRAAQLRKEIADLDREQADNAIELDRARALAGGDLSGQGEGERENRAALLGLVGEYQSYIGTLAESGASQDELRKATERARKEFIAQALELGYQEDVVLEYAKAFDDVRTAIDNVPRDITVDANVNPALQALNELNASLQTQIRAANDLNRALNQPVSAPSGGDGSTERTPFVQRVEGEQYVRTERFIADRFDPNRVTITAAQVAFVSPRTIDRGFSDGGFTGRGGTMDPAGIVHKGEYVVPQKYVNQSTGLPDANFLAQLQNGVRGYAQGGFVGGGGNGMGDGTMMVELSPYDRKLLSDAGNVQLRLNGKVVAEATNANNFNEARRGSN